MERTYEEFILERLSVEEARLNNNVVSFAKQYGLGFIGLKHKDIFEKCLYEYGITNSEIKSYFFEYLVLEEEYFFEKYGDDAKLLPRLKEKGLINACETPLGAQYDAEFYFYNTKFKKAIQIYRKYEKTCNEEKSFL